VHEVELAERRPLRDDLRADLLDLLVDFLNAAGVVLDRLNSLGRERREHDVGGHASSSGPVKRRPGYRGNRPATFGSFGTRPTRARAGAVKYQGRLRGPPRYRDVDTNGRAQASAPGPCAHEKVSSASKRAARLVVKQLYPAK